jgi:hypothetical protein
VRLPSKDRCLPPQGQVTELIDALLKTIAERRSF